MIVEYESTSQMSVKLVDVALFNDWSTLNDATLGTPKFKWDIIGLAEIKKEGKEILETEEHIFMYYGLKSGSNGVGFLVKNKWKSNIIDLKIISDRVVRLDIWLNSREMSIIQCYAPTEKYKYEHVELFYSEIRHVLEHTGRDTIVMGDFNSRIGQPTSDDKKIMGPWGYGNKNDRGEFTTEYKNIKSRKAFGMRSLQLNPVERESLKNIFISLTDSFVINEIQNTYANLIERIQETTSKLPTNNKKELSPMTQYIETLIEERNRLKLKENKTQSERNKLSAMYKLVKTLLEKNRKAHRYKIIEEELEKRASVKRAQIKLDKTKKWITTLNKNKSAKTNRNEIISIASEFYQKLYNSKEIIQNSLEELNSIAENTPPFLQ
ncbi:putative endonuclease-reverse transcriptase, partial [Operophtera brumata]